MTFLATTTVAILGAAEDASDDPDVVGDEQSVDDTPRAGLETVPASIIERTRTMLDTATGERRTIRVVTGRLRADIDVTEADRIRDNATGKVYAIDELTRTPRNLAGMSALTLDLRDARG